MVIAYVHIHFGKKSKRVFLLMVFKYVLLGIFFIQIFSTPVNSSFLDEVDAFSRETFQELLDKSPDSCIVVARVTSMSDECEYEHYYELQSLFKWYLTKRRNENALGLVDLITHCPVTRIDCYEVKIDREIALQRSYFLPDDFEKMDVDLLSCSDSRFERCLSSWIANHPSCASIYFMLRGSRKISIDSGIVITFGMVTVLLMCELASSYDLFDDDIYASE